MREGKARLLTLGESGRATATSDSRKGSRVRPTPL